MPPVRPGIEPGAPPDPPSVCAAPPERPASRLGMESIYLKLFLTAVFVFLNGFFVAAEFALVKTRPSRVAALVATGDKIMVEDETGAVANVTIADVDQSNGVIHVIDKVLLPKS